MQPETGDPGADLCPFFGCYGWVKKPANNEKAWFGNRPPFPKIQPLQTPIIRLFLAFSTRIDGLGYLFDFGPKSIDTSAFCLL